MSVEKINDLSNSEFRKRFFNVEFVPENNIAISSVRVSGKKQERGKSIAEQKGIIENYRKSVDLKIVDTYEITESASIHELRKHYLLMIAAIRASQSTKKPIKHILFSHQSRCSRNKESARELEELVGMGITLHFARDRRKLTCKSDIAEIIVWVIENLKNESFITELTQNSMGGVIQCIEQGRYPGSKLPFGYYSIGKKDQRRFEHDGERAKYMAAAFEIVDTTYDTVRLSDKELKSKLDAMFPKLGKTPNKKKFCQLLRNPFYNGEEFIWAKVLYKADPEIPGLNIEVQRVKQQ